MNTPRNSLVSLFTFAALIVFGVEALQAASGTWKMKPESGDWNNGANWLPGGAPNGSSDIATFGMSSVTNIFLSANTEVNGITFDAAASPFTITASPNFSLTLSGTGITNQNVLITQRFVANVDGAGNVGKIFFANDSSAGISTSFATNGGALTGTGGGIVQFFNDSTAGEARFTNHGNVVTGADGGVTKFSGSSTAGNGTFINEAGAARNPVVSSFGGGSTQFFDSSTAGNGTFINNGQAQFSDTNGGCTKFYDNSSAGNGTFFVNGAGLDLDAHGGRIEFQDSSTAANGTFTVDGGSVFGAEPGAIFFSDTSTAGNGNFTINAAIISFGSSSSAGQGTFTINSGYVYFSGNSTAEKATLIANGGTFYFDEDSTGVDSRVVLGDGGLDISSHNASLTIGSVEGQGVVHLGANALSVGHNNLNTSFSGSIHDGGYAGGKGGSLTKIGTGTLTLSGTSSYTGSTIVNAGKLIVDGSIMSAPTVNGGTLGGSGTTGAITVNKGGNLAPGSSAGILNVIGNLRLALGSTYLVDLNGTAVGKEYDQANVTGVVTIEGATLSLNLGFTPMAGVLFTIINNDLSDMVIGTFDGLSEGATFVSGGQAFTISYHGGDGNDVVLNAVPEPQIWSLILFGVSILIFARKRNCRLTSTN